MGFVRFSGPFRHKGLRQIDIPAATAAHIHGLMPMTGFAPRRGAFAERLETSWLVSQLDKTSSARPQGHIRCVSLHLAIELLQV